VTRSRRRPLRSNPTTPSSKRFIARWGESSGRPSPRILKAQRRIVDLLQILVLRRPNMVCVIEDVLEGILSSTRRGDDPDTENGET
jgi:hypothetical protein